MDAMLVKTGITGVLLLMTLLSFKQLSNMNTGLESIYMGLILSFMFIWFYSYFKDIYINYIEKED